MRNRLGPFQVGMQRRKRQCDNYNLKSHRRCNNMSHMTLSGFVGHVLIQYLVECSLLRAV